jgi:hypothetical protein
MNPVRLTASRLANWVSVGLYRRTAGRLAGRGRGKLPLLLLTVPRRKTGIPYTVPVVYFEPRTSQSGRQIWTGRFPLLCCRHA